MSRDGAATPPSRVDVAELQRQTRAARRRRGLSLRAAAQQVGVPFNSLRRVEVEDGYRPDLATFVRLVNWVGVPPDRYFPRDGDDAREYTPDVVARTLAHDPHLPPPAAQSIADMVRQLYTLLAGDDRDDTGVPRARDVG